MKKIINQPIDVLFAVLSILLIPFVVVVAILYGIVTIIERSFSVTIDKNQTLFTAVAIFVFAILLAWGAIFDNDDTPDTYREYQQ